MRSFSFKFSTDLRISSLGGYCGPFFDEQFGYFQYSPRGGGHSKASVDDL